MVNSVIAQIKVSSGSHTLSRKPIAALARELSITQEKAEKVWVALTISKHSARDSVSTMSLQKNQDFAKNSASEQKKRILAILNEEEFKRLLLTLKERTEGVEMQKRRVKALLSSKPVEGGSLKASMQTEKSGN